MSSHGLRKYPQLKYHHKMLQPHVLTLKHALRTNSLSKSVCLSHHIKNRTAHILSGKSDTLVKNCNTNCWIRYRYLNVSPLKFSKMGKTALVIIANGSEEIEAVTPIDTLRRAGVDVTVAGLNGAGDTIMSRNVIVGAEKSLKEALASAPFDAIILPGGAKGSEAFVESAEVGEILREQEKAGRLVAAICAAPTALHKHNICVGKSVTSYPSMKEKMTAEGKYQYKEDRVVVDGNLITSRGPGTSLEFSLAVAAYLVGQEKADEVGKAMLVQ